MKRWYVLLAVALSIAAVPVAAQLSPVDATKRPACVDGRPWSIWLLNESTSTDCDTTAGGSSEALCCCKEGSVAACSSGGGGSSNSFETIDLPSGTDPVADSSADTLAVTCAAPLTCTGNSGADSWAFGWSGTPIVAADIDTSAELRTILSDESGTGAASFWGSNPPTATALAANGGNCTAPEYPLGVDASGVAESCTVPGLTVLDTETTGTTINNTVAETTIYTYTMPGGTLGANDYIRLHLDNEFLNNTGSSRGFIIKAKLGGTTVIEFTTGANWAGSSATRLLVEVDLRLSALGATNSQIVTLRWQMNSTANNFGTLTTGVGKPLTTSPPFFLANSGALSQDMTSSKALEVSITLSTNSTNLEWKTYSGTLERIRP